MNDHLEDLKEFCKIGLPLLLFTAVVAACVIWAVRGHDNTLVTSVGAEFDIRGHHYLHLICESPRKFEGIVHDPDCRCHQ